MSARNTRVELGRAALVVRADDLLTFLDLPAGTTVRAVDISNDPPQVRLVVEHEDLPPVEPYAESPSLMATMVAFLDGRRPGYRWDFPGFRELVLAERARMGGAR